MNKAKRLHEKTIAALRKEREANSLRIGQNEIWEEDNGKDKEEREKLLLDWIARTNEEIARKKNEFEKWVQDSEIEAKRRDQENSDLLERNLEITKDIKDLEEVVL